MNISFWLGYHYRNIEFIWAFVRIKIMVFTSRRLSKWSTALSNSAERVLDSQDARLRKK